MYISKARVRNKRKHPRIYVYRVFMVPKFEGMKSIWASSTGTVDAFEGLKLARDEQENPDRAAPVILRGAYVRTRV